MTALQRMPMANDESHHPGSWAQVAVSKYPTGVQNGGHYTPYPNANYGPRDPSSDGEGSSPRMTGVSLAPEIPTEPKAGVIRIHGKVTRDAIQFITTRIHEGPLLEIQIENKACVRVSFQHATQAQAFLKSNQEMEQMAGFGRFGVGYHIELAEVVDWNEDHRRMNQPVRERRRLSFARKRLFADNMTPEKWRQDVKNVAGVANIDFLWVFNSGNGECHTVPPLRLPGDDDGMWRPTN